MGNTVNPIAQDATKDVLLEVYAPWCGACESFAPIYARLAKAFAGIDSVVIAKLDGTENDHPDVEIEVRFNLILGYFSRFYIFQTLSTSFVSSIIATSAMG